MRKLMTMAWAILAVTALAASSAFASATYQWVTTDRGLDDSGYRITAQWLLTDAEYQSRLFSTLNPGDEVTGTIEATLANGAEFVLPLAHNTYNFFYGVLTADRQSIAVIRNYEGNSDGASIFDTVWDAGVALHTNRVWGSIDCGMFFDLDNLPVNDPYGIGRIDLAGRWELVESVPVPEPGTFALMVLAVGGVAMWSLKRRREAAS